MPAWVSTPTCATGCRRGEIYRLAFLPKSIIDSFCAMRHQTCQRRNEDDLANDLKIQYMPLKFKIWPIAGLVAAAAVPLVTAKEPERIYSLEEVAIIDRETKLWRLVDATKTVDANLGLLSAAGFPATEVEAIKPRLVAMWEVDLGLRLDWLGEPTLTKIRELEPEFIIQMRKARARNQVVRLGGAREPLTPEQIKGRWRSEIVRLLSDRELQEFTLMNSPSAVALDKLTKDLVLTVDERRTLYQWKQQFEGDKLMVRSQSHLKLGEIAARLQEAQLDHWQRMRDLLGDDRFEVYLRAADAGFAHMADVLNQIPDLNRTDALNLWWIRKKDQLADTRMIWGSERYQLKVKAYEAAVAVLGAAPLKIYEVNADAKWLERKNPYAFNKSSRAARAGDYRAVE